MLDSTTIEPFDQALNDAIVHITDRIVGPFTTSDDAPGSYRKLKEYLDAGNQMKVATAGSEAKIFGDPYINCTFRAWHDWCHWKGECNFSLAGEMEVCCIQLQHLQRFYGINERTCYWRSLLIAEIIGQARYYWRHKAYVEDQRSFALAYIANPEHALSLRW